MEKLTEWKYKPTKEAKEKAETTNLVMKLKHYRELCFHTERELMQRGVEVKPVKRSLGFYDKHLTPNNRE